MRDYALGTTFDLKFTTRSFTTGAPTTLAGSPVISAYPDNSTTELTAGITLTVDFDSRTGMHNVRVVASGGNGYASGSNYALVITTGTVGGVSVVGEVIGEFSIEAQSPLRPTTAGQTIIASNLDAAITSRMATYTQPTGFLAATFPSGTVANTTNITAGTITTVTNLTNAPTAGDLTATMKTSVTTAATASTPTIAGTQTFNNTGTWTGNITGSVNSVTGLTASNLDTTVSSRMATYTQPTGFLAATFPSGTVANTTNITAGTVTTATNLTTNNDKTGYALTSGERTSVADAILARDIGSGSNTGSSQERTVRSALRFLRNKWVISGTTLTVNAEDDSTAMWTATVTATAGANPITANDPT